jgi:hypothetical protein
MIEDSKIRISAQMMIDRLGSDAFAMACERAVELEALGDSEGFAAWRRIASAIRLLEREGATASH